jgi:hypothetical protein
MASSMIEKQDKLTWRTVATLLTVASILVLVGWFVVDMASLDLAE